MPKKPSLLSQRMSETERTRPSKTSAWKGPTKEGVTQSMLGYYIICKERFRTRHIDGLKSVDSFNVPIEFGNMWHICEEYHAAGKDWTQPLKEYFIYLMKTYRMEQDSVDKWYNVCVVQFPIYVKYWKDHDDVKKRIPLIQEEKFKVDYRLPSGRTALLRGKWDSIDIIKGEGIYLQENKSKSKIDPLMLEKQLLYDIQTMTYLTAMICEIENKGTLPGITDKKLFVKNKVLGIRYNVIKRALSGGKGTIVQHKARGKRPAETKSQYYSRVREILINDSDSYFRRWKIEVSPREIANFRHRTLDPLLENLLDDYEWWDWCKLSGHDHYDYLTRAREFKHHISRQFRLPYGIHNAIAEGGYGKIDDYLNFGSLIGIKSDTQFFPELQ